VSDAAHIATGRRILSFLKDALEQRDPERDIPLASEIRSESEASLPEEEHGRAAALEALSQPAVEEFVTSPEMWGEAVNLVAIYLDGRRRNTPPERIRLSSVLLRALLLANAAGRTVFFRGIDEWNLLHALEPVLPGLALEPAEIVTLVCRIDAFTANDMARGSPMEAFKRWAAAHAGAARCVIDAWLDDEDWTGGLELSSIQVLVEGAVRGSSDGIAWRDAMIGRLLQANDEQRWALAATLACFAWPEPEPPVEERHKALLQHVSRLPARLVDVGMRAVARDQDPGGPAAGGSARSRVSCRGQGGLRRPRKRISSTVTSPGRGACS
jgi:hypothetical protein